MTKDQTRKTLTQLARQIDELFKRSNESIFEEVRRDWAGVGCVLTPSNDPQKDRNELLPILIKGYIYNAFDPDTKRLLKYNEIK